MKTRKLKFLIPMLAVVFAIASAFGTSANTEVESFALVTGYIDTPDPCMQSVTCSLIQGPVCTNGTFGQQAFAKSNPSATTCPIVVYRSQ